MIALMDEYRTQLSDVCGYADQTVENYASCMGMFVLYLKEQDIRVVQAQGDTHLPVDSSIKTKRVQL